MSAVFCSSVDDIVREALAIINRDKRENPEPGAEYFFRGEASNFKHENDPSAPLSESIPSNIDRLPQRYLHEREIYEAAMRFNVFTFDRDKTMVERVQRMQHYLFPTRFLDISESALLSSFFACDGDRILMGDADRFKHDGFVRIIKVAPHKMKSFQSDIICAIAHLAKLKPDRFNPSKPDGLDTLRYEVTNERPGFSMDTADIGKGWRARVNEQLREQIQQCWAFKPLIRNDRIDNQNALFIAYGARDKKKPLNPEFSYANYEDKSKPSYGIVQVGYLQIPAKAKQKIQEDLRYFGVIGEKVYPEMSHVGQEIDARIKAMYKNEKKEK